MAAQQFQVVYGSLFPLGGIATGLDCEVNSGFPKKKNEKNTISVKLLLSCKGRAILSVITLLSSGFVRLQFKKNRTVVD